MRYGTTRAAPKFFAIAPASNSNHEDWKLSCVRQRMPKSDPSNSLPSSWTQTTPGSIWAEMKTFAQDIQQKGLQPQRGGSAAFSRPTDENSFRVQLPSRAIPVSNRRRRSVCGKTAQATTTESRTPKPGAPGAGEQGGRYRGGARRRRAPRVFCLDLPLSRGFPVVTAASTSPRSRRRAPFARACCRMGRNL